MIIRLSNIVIRRPYLEDMISVKVGQSNNLAPRDFWKQMSIDLFNNILELHEQIEAFISLRSQDEGFPAIILFCIYTCGSLSYYLVNWPSLCPTLATKGPIILNRSMEVLKGLSGAWPLAMRWQQALSRFVQVPKRSESGNLNTQGPPQEQYADLPPDQETGRSSSPAKPQTLSSAANLDLLVNAAVQNDQQHKIHSSTSTNLYQQQQSYLNIQYNNNPEYLSPTAFAADDFESELNAFLQGGEAAPLWNGAG